MFSLQVRNSDQKASLTFSTWKGWGQSLNNLGAKNWWSIFDLVCLKLSLFCLLEVTAARIRPLPPHPFCHCLAKQSEVTNCKTPRTCGDFPAPPMINLALKPDSDLESNFFLWNCHHMTQRSGATAGHGFFFRLETELENCLACLASL